MRLPLSSLHHRLLPVTVPRLTQARAQRRGTVLGSVNAHPPGSSAYLAPHTQSSTLCAPSCPTLGLPSHVHHPPSTSIMMDGPGKVCAWGALHAATRHAHSNLTVPPIHQSALPPSRRPLPRASPRASPGEHHRAERATLYRPAAGILPLSHFARSKGHRRHQTAVAMSVGPAPPASRETTDKNNGQGF